MFCAEIIKYTLLLAKGRKQVRNLALSCCLGAPAQLENSHHYQGEPSASHGCLLRVNQCPQYPGRDAIQAEDMATDNTGRLVMISQSHSFLC